MALTLLASLAVMISNVLAQQAGQLEQEEGPTMTLKECTLAGGCVSKQAKLTLDSNWRWIHETTGHQNCYTGNSWNTGICTSPATCSQKCALEGVSKQKYRDTYGITQIEGGVQLNFVTQHSHGVNVGSRLYLMDGDDQYKMFYLKNREFAMDLDVSHLECGMNGAMYFVEMDRRGDKGSGNNQAGAKYGTGYCDAQCPHDIKFIKGEANTVDWVPNPKDKSNNMGSGKFGSCCAEMDIWEANSMATAYTPHPCSMEGQLKCEGTECGDNDKGERYQGVCDKDGCDINPFRMGNKTFYGRGPGFTIDTSKPMTVVTQFLTTDGTDSGDLSEIRRFYVQDGHVIHSPPSTILGPDNSDSITDAFCSAKKDLFDDVNDFQAKNGNRGMGESLDRGQVLAISLWDDVDVNMLWLDSAFPLDKPVTDPGVQRGNCPGGESSTPTYVRNKFPNGYARFTNAAIGEIGSTTTVPVTPTPTPVTPAPSPAGCTLEKRVTTCNLSGGIFKCIGCEDALDLELCCSCEGATTSPTPTPTTPSTAPTPAPTQSPTPTPTAVQVCKSWCKGNSKSWDKKCGWTKCKGCPECSGRRLRGSSNDDAQMWL